MQRRYLIVSLVIGLSAISQMCSGDYWGYLTGVDNKTPVEIPIPGEENKTVKVETRVTIKTSDSQGTIKKKDGTTPSIQNQEFDLSEIESMNLAIPQESWDQDAEKNAEILISLIFNAPFRQGIFLPNTLTKVQYSITDRDDQIHISRRRFQYEIIGHTQEFDNPKPIWGWVLLDPYRPVVTIPKNSNAPTNISLVLALDSLTVIQPSKEPTQYKGSIFLL